MGIALIFTYASKQEYGVVVKEYSFFREEHKLSYTVGENTETYVLEPGDSVTAFFGSSMSVLKRNK